MAGVLGELGALEEDLKAVPEDGRSGVRAVHVDAAPGEAAAGRLVDIDDCGWKHEGRTSEQYEADPPLLTLFQLRGESW